MFITIILEIKFIVFNENKDAFILLVSQWLLRVSLMCCGEKFYFRLLEYLRRIYHTALMSRHISQLLWQTPTVSSILNI